MGVFLLCGSYEYCQTLHVQVFMWTYIFSFLLGTYLGVESPGHMVILRFTLGGPARLFPQSPRQHPAVPAPDWPKQGFPIWGLWWA